MPVRSLPDYRIELSVRPIIDSGTQGEIGTIDIFVMSLNRDHPLLARRCRADLKILPHLGLVLLDLADAGTCSLDSFSQDLLSVAIKNKRVIISNSHRQLCPLWCLGGNFIGPADIHRAVFPPHRLEHRLVIIIAITKSGSAKPPLSSRLLIPGGRNPVNRHRGGRVLMPLADRSIFAGMDYAEARGQKKEK